VSPDEYLRQRLEHHLPDEPGKPELIALLLPLLAMGTRQSAATWVGLREEVAQAVVLAVKDDAERHWRIAWEGSLERANQILAIGEARGNLAVQALGTMAKADAIKMDKARWREAWVMLDHAAELYLHSGLSAVDRAIGWARTRIGRVFMAPELGETEVAYTETEKARFILEQYGEKRRLISLHINWARAYDIQMEVTKAFAHYERALEIAIDLGKEGEDILPTIYHNMGIALDGMGQTQKAISYLYKSLDLVNAKADQYSESFRAIRELTLGSLYRYLGAYGRALRLAYKAEPILEKTHPRQWAASLRLLMRCHLDLRRYADARLYGQKLLEYGSHYPRDLAFTHRFLAQVEIGAGNFLQAQSHLQYASTLLSDSEFGQLLALIRIEEGWLALKQEQFEQVLDICKSIKNLRNNQPTGTYDVETLLIEGEAYWALQDIDSSEKTARHALHMARRLRRMPYQYRAYLLLGKIAEAKKHYQKAERYFQAALATTTRVHQSAGHTLHADVSEAYHLAFHALMQLQLKQGKIQQAFATLEFQKNHLFLAYLHERERLQWSHSPETTPILEELAQLRAEYHQWLRQQEHDERMVGSAHIGNVEQRIRRLTEYLYLSVAKTGKVKTEVPTLQELQQALPEGAVLIAYYDDGTTLWCFIIDSTDIQAHPIGIAHRTLMETIEHLYENHQTTLQNNFPNDALSRIQAKKARQRYTELGTYLLTPIQSRLSYIKRLYVVPYGILHRLPFNLLRVDGQYLIEYCEIVTLPTSALLNRRTEPSAIQNQERRWIGYSHNGRLPNAIQEVRQLHAQWGGDLFLDQAAKTGTLNGNVCQVLHLSTHAVHRVDHYFDLSYLAMADADILEDDVLQMNLHHDLVTLSACETGVMKISPGEDLIGLGRAFLYAGVGAIVSSLWQVREEISLEMMNIFYRRLFAGDSKSAALREAQLEVLKRYSLMHPVYWGAFQLVGNENPLFTGEPI
jgi:CHAT domain-containing protein